MSDKLLSLFDDLERQTAPREKILRSPFPYPGGKSRSVEMILKHLPYRNTYIEPFGGSAAVLLARHKSNLEVYNDLHGGVVDFYRCIRDPKTLQLLHDRLELTVHSREEFVWCKETWDQCDDLVERAARWYYLTNYSFASLGRNWGRSTSGKSAIAGKVTKKLKMFPLIQERFARVQCEIGSWECVMSDYDSSDTVIYCDPPYVDAHTGTYKNEMSVDDHRHFLDTVFSLDSFIAVSGFSNPLYDNQKWDRKEEWDVYCSITPAAFKETNNKSEHTTTRGKQKECLWIKEANHV